MRKIIMLFSFVLILSLVLVPAYASGYYPDVNISNNFPDTVTIDGTGTVSIASADAPGVTVTPVVIDSPADGIVSALVSMVGNHVGDVYSVVGSSIFVPSLPWVLAGVVLVVCLWCLFRFGGAVFGRR